MLKFITDSIKERKEGYQRLRQMCDDVGKEFEKMSYDALQNNSEENFNGPTLEYKGKKITFSGEARVLENGDIHYDLRLCCPALFRLLPSYRFFKKPNGTVYY